MTVARRLDHLEESNVKHGERLGHIEIVLERMTVIMQLQLWVSGIVGSAVILGMLARIARLI